MLTDLDATLDEAGVRFVEVPGWRTRGRPGGMSAVHTITCHHTAGGRSTDPTRSLRIVREGRPDLPGPLAQLYLDTTGLWHIVAAGRANHAGVSLSPDFENEHAIGIEAEAAGDGWAKDWPDAQMASYALGCAALVRRYGLDVADVRGHKETCSPRGRKTDPSFDMPAFRRRVAEQLEELDMPSAKEIAAEVIKQLEPVLDEHLEDWLTKRKIVPNAKQPWEDPATPVGFFTMVGALSNTEKDTDRPPAPAASPVKP